MAGFVGLKRLLFCTYSFSSKPDNKKVTLYFQCAKLIDTIRLALRPNDTSFLTPLLNDPNLDSFVVANALKATPQFRHTQHTIYALAKVVARFQQSQKLKALIDGINSGSDEHPLKLWYTFGEGKCLVILRPDQMFEHK